MTVDNPHLTLEGIKAIDLTFPIAAFLSTSTRLLIKYRIGNFWWDDGVAILATMFCGLMSSTNFIHYMNPAKFDQSTKIIAYYCISESFYLSLWTSRLSMLFSILRIAPDMKTRRFLKIVSIVFVCVLAFLFCQVFWVCESQPGWKNLPKPQCALGRQVAVCQLVTDISADFLLIGIPVRLLSQTAFPRGIKIRVLIIFGAASLITVVSLIHAAYILAVRGIEANLTGIVEISVAVMVCNVIVILPAIWRLCGLLDDSSDSTAGTVRLTSMHFATGGQMNQRGTANGAINSSRSLSNPTATTGTYQSSSKDLLHIKDQSASFDDETTKNPNLNHVLHSLELPRDAPFLDPKSG